MVRAFKVGTGAVLILALALTLGLGGHSALAQDDQDVAPTGVVFDISGVQWREYIQVGSGKIFYHDEASGITQWEDPRSYGTVRRSAQSRKEDTLEDSITRALIVAIPLLLLLAGFAVRIWYLHTHYPELLFPTKVRKQRQRFRNKERPQRGRFKMSQDGKGGRSANS